MDPAAAALAFVLQLLGLPVNASELLHQTGTAQLEESDLLRLARKFPVRARVINTNITRLAATPLPALAPLADGRWLVLGRVGDGKVLAQDPQATTPIVLTLEAFAKLWDGRLLLITRRAALTDPYRRFGI